MVEITLSAYIHEIDNLIEQNQQLDEAIAHCRYILKSFPKHVATYRLLGKAYLEAKQYGDAADLFQRVLSAVPDDFISHVGMAIIREDEGNLDASIWHMERASEARPGNPAIEQELKRLIGKRDGLEPQRIRPTRGALARMYFHGELYPYAQSELQSALSEEPDRPDLQVLLAKTYFRMEKSVESAELCGQILENLPYCFDALRISAKLLQSQEPSEETSTYERRLHALNPYTAFIEDPMEDPDEVDASAIVLDRLEWVPGQPLPSSTPDQPDWAVSLGVDLGEEQIDEDDLQEVPSWLTSTEEAEEVDSPEEELPIVHPFAGAKPPPGTELPEWMQEAGWEPSDGEVSEQEVSSLPEPPSIHPEDDELAPADLPSWLKEIAPEAEEEPTAPPEEVEQDLPEWLSDTTIEAGDVEEPSPIQEIDQADIESALPSETFPEVEGEISPDEQAAEEEAFELPTWLDETSPGASDSIVSWLVDKEGEKEKPPVEDVPEWMQGTGPLDEEKIAATEEEPAAAEEPVETFAEDLALSDEAVADKDEIEWLRESPEEMEDYWEDLPSEEQEEAPEWLEELRIDEEDVPSEPEMPETPEWLSDVEEGAPEPSFEEAEETEPTPAWLEEIISEKPSEEELVTEGEKEPDWLQGLAEAQFEVEEEPSPPPVEREEEVSELEPPSEEISEPSVEEEEEIEEKVGPPQWMLEITEAAEAREAEEETPADFELITDRAEAEEPPSPREPLFEPTQAAPEHEIEPPDWLQEITQLRPTPATAEPPTEEEAPDWLKELTTSELVGEPPVAAPEETPDWLQEIISSEPGPIMDEAADEDLSRETAKLEQLASEQEPSPPEPEAAWKPEFEAPEEPEAEVEKELEAEAFEEPSPEIDEPIQVDAEEEWGEKEALEYLEDLAASQVEPELPPETPEMAVDAEPVETPIVEPDRELPEEPEESLDWLEELAAEEPAEDEELPTFAEEEEEEIPDWLAAIAEEPGEVEEPSEPSAEPVSAPEPTQEITPSETAEEPPSDEEMGVVSARPEVEEISEVPSPQLEAEGVEIEAEDTAPIEEVAVEPAPDEALPEEKEEEPTVAELPPDVEPEPVPLPAEEPPAEEEKGILELARTALERDEIDQAVHHYQNALMEKEYLDTIISDLKEATERSPHSPALWQALGDAFMKNNSFSDAIDSYRRGVEAM